METHRHRRNFNDPGHAHELTFACYHQFPFLKVERTCPWLADSISAARESLEFDLWAFVFMPDHVHLIVHPRRPDYGIAAIRQAIKEPVARQAFVWLEENAPEWLPRLTVRKGDRIRRHFWQTGGGLDRNIIEPRTLQSMIDDVHMNPVRRGLVERSLTVEMVQCRVVARSGRITHLTRSNSPGADRLKNRRPIIERQLRGHPLRS